MHETLQKQARKCAKISNSASVCWLKCKLGLHGAITAKHEQFHSQLLQESRTIDDGWKLFEKFYNSCCAEEDWSDQWNVHPDAIVKDVPWGSRSIVDDLTQYKPKSSTCQVERRKTSKKSKVMVSISGGVASLAALWRVLQCTDVEVHLCYLVGVDRSIVERELAVLLELIKYGRDQNGRPFVSPGVDNALRHPDCRLKLLPMPTQLFTRRKEATTTWKHHPSTYVLMYRQILTAAQSADCTQIVWGLFDKQRDLLESIAPFFHKRVGQVENWFPFNERLTAIRTLCHGGIRSNNVWKRSNSPSEFTDTATLMPDVAQLAWTCSKFPSTTSIDKNLDENAVLADDFNLYNWCSNCIDCNAWKTSANEFRKNNSLSSLNLEDLNDERLSTSNVETAYKAALVHAMWDEIRPAKKAATCSDETLVETLRDLNNQKIDDCLPEVKRQKCEDDSLDDVDDDCISVSTDESKSSDDDSLDEEENVTDEDDENDQENENWEEENNEDDDLEESFDDAASEEVDGDEEDYEY